MTQDMNRHFSMSALLKYTFPTICMMIFTSLYEVVDGFFVSNFVGKTALAAVNLAWPGRHDPRDDRPHDGHGWQRPGCQDPR